MNKTLKKLSWFLIGMLTLIVLGANTIQMIGPSTPTTFHSLVRWNSSNSFSTTNSGITVDDYNNIFGVATQTVSEILVLNSYVTNGIIYQQKSSAPTASSIGGTVGSLTNYQIIDVNGFLNIYYSDGTTLYGPKQIAP